MTTDFIPLVPLASSGGRGTFIGTLMGAGLSVQVLNATVFLSLDQKWQYIFQGLLIVAAAVIYSQVRRGAIFGLLGTSEFKN